MKTISPFVHSAKQQTESQQDEQAEHTESIHRNAPNPHRPNTLTTDDHSICCGTLATAFEKRSSKSLTHESCVGCLHSQRTSPFVHPRSPQSANNTPPEDTKLTQYLSEFLLRPISGEPQDR